MGEGKPKPSTVNRARVEAPARRSCVVPGYSTTLPIDMDFAYGQRDTYTKWKSGRVSWQVEKREKHNRTMQRKHESVKNLRAIVQILSKIGFWPGMEGNRPTSNFVRRDDSMSSHISRSPAASAILPIYSPQGCSTGKQRSKE